MGCMACTAPQCLYKGDLYLYFTLPSFTYFITLYIYLFIYLNIYLCNLFNLLISLHYVFVYTFL